MKPQKNYYNMKTKLINKSNNPDPFYETEGSAGMDLRADLQKDEYEWKTVSGSSFYKTRLKPLERILIPTGLFIELPQGHEAQIRPRSGLAFKHGITVLNSPGTIDSDYRGEIKVLLINLSNETYTIQHGDRIAQMVITKHENITWDKTNSLDSTERGEGGFGSTGK